ncbi:MAG: lamin tail domain-containing protein [Planctomycetes bacterium]|nr:lamin tail domain-containing protein [Planctomycetota bacterium]
MRLIPALLSGLLWTAVTATAQVRIHEINFTPQNASDDVWIELFNSSSSPADLSLWSMYQATNTAGAAQNYWFAFPAGTVIPGGGFLRVHWFQPIKPTTPTDLWTGNSVFNFLFGYGAEPLAKTGGAIALLNTQSNSRMNDPSAFMDWVSWGAPGLKREDLAVQAGLWFAGQFAPVPVNSDSLALIEARQAEPTPATAFFSCAFPTPLRCNTCPQSVTRYGNACAVGSVPTPLLDVLSVPVRGNRDFGFQVGGTVPNQQVFLLLAANRSPGGINFGPCEVLVDPTLLLPIGPFPTTAGTTRIPLALLSPELSAGARIVIQGLVVTVPATFFDFGFSGGVDLVVGG